MRPGDLAGAGLAATGAARSFLGGESCGLMFAGIGLVTGFIGAMIIDATVLD